MKRGLNIKDLDKDERSKIKQLLLEARDTDESKADNGQEDDKDGQERSSQPVQGSGTTATDNKKLNWMYGDGKVSSDEYLMGRRINQLSSAAQGQQQRQQGSENDDIAETAAPGALFREAASRITELDMKAKMRDDPLYVIERKEQEARKRILSNPLKRRKLEELLAQRQHLQEQQKKKKKEKKDKKKKKQKKKTDDKETRKKRRSSSDESDSSSFSGDELLNTFLSLVKPTSGEKKGENKTSSSSASKISTSSLSASHHRRSRDGAAAGREDQQSSRSTTARDYDGRDNERRSNSSYQQPDTYTRSDHHESSSKSRGDSTKGYPSAVPGRRSDRPKLSDWEKEAKRREMMEFAQDRDKQRVANVSRYRLEEEREKDKERINSTSASHSGSGGRKDKDLPRGKGEEKRRTRTKSGENTSERREVDGFLNNMMIGYAEKSSVEDRIQRNRYNLQRQRHTS